MDYKDTVVLVTGGSHGIGESIALAFAEKGACVAVASRRLEVLRNVAKKILSAGGRDSMALEADVSIEAQAKGMIADLLDKWGHIDVLINSAGGLRRGKIDEISIEDWDWSINSNVRGTFLATRYCVPSMKKRKKGTIFNLASTAGKTGFAGHASYCTSKFAIVGFSESLSKELAPYNIKVHCLCPGAVDTPFWDPKPKDERKEMISPEDIADLVIYLHELPAKVAVPEVVIRQFSDLA